jgi:hypothetical protein
MASQVMVAVVRRLRFPLGAELVGEDADEQTWPDAC